MNFKHMALKTKTNSRNWNKEFLDNTSCAVLLKELEFFERDQYRERRRQIATWYNNNLPYKCIPGKNYIWERYSLNVPFDES